MKAELKGNHIWLYGETEEERHLLNVLDKNGVRVFGRSSTGISITSPHLAGLCQLFVNREQQAILSYTLGIMEMLLLAKGARDIGQQDPLRLKGTMKMARDVDDLKDQLLIAPDPVLARLTVAKPIKPEKDKD